MPLKYLLPSWLRQYRRVDLSGDLVAGLVVCLLLVPQGLAYALLAGIPAHAGLYAALLPLIVYAWIGSSSQQSVGPMAVTALMTAAALAPFAEAGSARAAELALGLAILSGVMLVLFAVLRMGWLAHYLSQPVIAGFTAGSVVLILGSQVSSLLGINAGGRTLPILLERLWQQWPQTSLPTVGVSVVSLVFLWWSKSILGTWLQRWGMKAASAILVSRLMPAVLVLVAIAATAYWELDQAWGLQIVGHVPSGFPPFFWPDLSISDWQMLLIPALLLGFMNFVQSISVAQALALKRGERIDSNKELAGLGAANIAAGLTGGMPVTGGMSRSALNAAAGANTQLSSVVTAVLFGALLLGGTPMLRTLPEAVLAATIVMAVLNMFGFAEMKRIWCYDRADGFAMLATFLMVVFVGVGESIMTGVICSLGFMVWRSSRPHIAEVGRLDGSEHFRNVQRHEVETLPHVVFLRIDESLHFANIDYLDKTIARLSQRAEVRDVVLVMSAVNAIDASAFERLLVWQSRLQAANMVLHLAEVKGPVYDRLCVNQFEQRFKGRVFLSAHVAWTHFSLQ